MLSRAFHQLHFPVLSIGDVFPTVSISYISPPFHQLRFPAHSISYILPRFAARKLFCDLSSDWLRTAFSGALIARVITITFTYSLI